MSQDTSNDVPTSREQPNDIPLHQKVVPLSKRVLKSVDLFSFLPVPKAKPISSKRSLMGSLLMISAFLTYILIGFIKFVTDNAPRVNIYSNQLPDINITMPEIAFAFYMGETFTEQINNASLFTFQYQQVTKFKNITLDDIKIDIPLVQCQPDWLPQQEQPLLCPLTPGIMAGALYQTDTFLYPRISVNYCKPSATLTCATQTELAQTAAGGRIFLFIKDDGPDFDMTTGKTIAQVPYRVFQMFLIPGMYPRAQFYFQRAQFSIYPDYFRRFTRDVRNYLMFEETSTWMTNVSIYSTQNAFQIFFRMDLTQQVGFLVYATILDMISLWGAFWGVLFSAFAAYFLAYNQSQFYNENKDWEDFGTKVGVHKPKDIIDGDYYDTIYEESKDEKQSQLQLSPKQTSPKQREITITPQKKPNNKVNEKSDTMVFEMGGL